MSPFEIPDPVRSILQGANPPGQAPEARIPGVRPAGRVPAPDHRAQETGRAHQRIRIQPGGPYLPEAVSCLFSISTSRVTGQFENAKMRTKTLPTNGTNAMSTHHPE